MLSERGYFWWSDTEIPPDNFAPEGGVAGLLTITDGGRIKVELEGALPDPRGRWAALEPSDIPERKAIAGILHKDNRYVLVKNLHRSGSSFSTNGFSSQSFGALYCLIAHEPIPHRAKVRSLVCDLAGYEEWLRLGRLAEKRSSRGLTLKYEKKPELVFRHALGTARLTRRAGLDREGMFGSRGTRFVERAHLSLTPPRSLDLDGAVRLFGSVQDLLILLTNSEYQMSMPDVKLTSRQGARLYFGRTDSSAAPLPEFRDYVVAFPLIEATFGEMLFSWLQAREELGAAAYLYLATRRGLDIYEEHRFLNLMTGLEAYHRARIGDGDLTAFREKLDRILSGISKTSDRSWARKRLKNAGGPNLESRLIALLGGLPVPLAANDFTEFLSSCARARNQIAHEGHCLEAEASGAPLNWLSMRSAIIGMLYHARLLEEIGLPANFIGAWLRSQSHLPFYLRHAGLEVIPAVP